MKDIIFLVADKNIEYAVSTILLRSDSLQIREITPDIFVHPYRDPGVLNEAHEFLSPFQNKYRYAMVLFDKEGCGDHRDTKIIENVVERQLNNVGWNNRCAVIVLDPELEIWVWSDSPHVASALGWEKIELDLWLKNKNLRSIDNQKPQRPKEAMELALREKRIPRSSSIYAEIGSKVSLDRCTERSFLRFKGILQQWFPLEDKKSMKDGKINGKER